MIELLPSSERLLRTVVVDFGTSLNSAEMAALLLTMAAKTLNNLAPDEAEEILRDVERGELRQVMAALREVEQPNPWRAPSTPPAPKVSDTVN